MKKYWSSIDLLNSFSSFPLSSLFAIITTASLLILTEYHDNDLLIKISLAGYLSFVAAISSELWNKTKGGNSGKISFVVPFLIFAAWYFYLPDDINSVPEYIQPKLIYRFFASALILHLVVSFIPYLSKSTEEDFWEFNKHLFFRIFESVLFSLIIFAGLSLALLALDKLFGLSVKGEWYGRLFIFLGGIFNSLYFLSKFPKLEYDRKIDTPNSAYKVFTQYILIPIATVYLLLMYAYVVKIAIESSLPKGWIVYLTLCFSIIGVFTWLLNYFNLQFTHHSFTKLYKQYFFKLLTIPIILLWVAIIIRLSDYGLTENRYVVTLLAIWLSLLIIFYGWLRKIHIKYIPITFALLAFFAAFGGPLDMFSSSLRNQANRLKNTLIDKAILQNQTYVTSGIAQLPDNVHYLLKEQIYAVADRSDLGIMDDWVTEALFETYSDSLHFNKRDYLVQKFGLQNALTYSVKGSIEYFDLSSTRNDSIALTGYNKMTYFTLSKEELTYNKTVLITNNNEISVKPYDNFSLENLVKLSYGQKDQLPIEKMSVVLSDSLNTSKLIFEFINGKIEDGNIFIEGGQGWILEK